MATVEVPKEARILSDGTFIVNPCTRGMELKLDANFQRCKNQRRWYLKPNYPDVEDLRDEFQGDAVNIVGKGPSLDHIKKEHLIEGAPTICINESVYKLASQGVSNLYSLQQDARVGVLEGDFKKIVSYRASKVYDITENVYLYVPVKYNCHTASISSVCAIEICKSFGVKKFRMLCFDASVTNETEYAQCVTEHTPRDGLSPYRFLRHRGFMLPSLTDSSVEWALPDSKRLVFYKPRL